MGENQQIDFGELVREYYQALYRFAFSLTKNESEAGDMVQQTFLIYAQKGDAIRDSSKIKSWLFTTLYREFLRDRRKHKNASYAEPEMMENQIDEANPELARRLEAQEAVEAINQIDPVYREPLVLFYLDDLAYKEIAEVLDLPIGTVMSRLSRGKSQLKSVLSEKIRK